MVLNCPSDFVNKSLAKQYGAYMPEVIFAGPEGRLGHLGVMCEDLEATLGFSDDPKVNVDLLSTGLAINFARVTDTAALSRRSSQSTKHAGQALTRRSCRCMRVA